MQLKLATDYALRIILYLHIHQTGSSQEMSQKIGISQNYIKKLTSQSNLRRFVSSNPTGFVLKCPGHLISVYDVVSAMESSMMINECLEDMSKCEECVTFQCECPIRKSYQKVQKNLKCSLKAITFHDLTENYEDFAERMKSFSW